MFYRWDKPLLVATQLKLKFIKNIREKYLRVYGFYFFVVLLPISNSKDILKFEFGPYSKLRHWLSQTANVWIFFPDYPWLPNLKYSSLEVGNLWIYRGKFPPSSLLPTLNLLEKWRVLDMLIVKQGHEVNAANCIWLSASIKNKSWVLGSHILFSGLLINKLPFWVSGVYSIIGLIFVPCWRCINQLLPGKGKQILCNMVVRRKIHWALHEYFHP